MFTNGNLKHANTLLVLPIIANALMNGNMAKKLKPRIEQYRAILVDYGKDYANI